MLAFLMSSIPKPSLAETHPEIAKQADGWDPTTLTAGSNKKVDWKCQVGHKAGIDKFDGYSEAWTKASLNVTSIKQILDWVYEEES